MGNQNSNPHNEGFDRGEFQIHLCTFFTIFLDPSDLSETERTEFNTQIVTEITSKSLVRSSNNSYFPNILLDFYIV